MHKMNKDPLTADNETNNDYANNFNTINVITNFDTFPGMAALPATYTPPPAVCASQHPCSTTLPASTYLVTHDVESIVPDIPTIVHRDLPPDSMPGQASFTTSNISPSVNCVEGQDKNLTGHGKGHGFMDCSLGNAAGHQQPESVPSCVSLPVTPIVRTFARAASLS